MRILFLATLLLLSFTAVSAQPQAPSDRRGQMGSNYGQNTLYGDVVVDESKAGNTKPLVYEIVLNNLGGTPVARQYVSSKGRYRFINLVNGQYELVVMLDGDEIGRTRVELMAPTQNDFRQDLSLEWRPPAANKPGSISTADFYKRSSANEKLFVKAKESTDQKRYDDSIAALQQLVTADPKDFQAWAELGTVYLFKQNYEESEKAYLRSTTERPGFFLAQMNLGRLRVVRKNFEGAIEPLTEAVKIQPTSADANFYLGEAYLQLKKGSKGVPYLYEALKLDPVGKAEAHLRLAALYNAVGLKDKAAVEYEEFLKKKPEYPDRKKLEQYISSNKGAPETKKP
jgi:tetratricopeptide (TPR) repeat protein